VPSLPFGYRRPKIADEFFRVKTGINNAVVLSYEFLSTVFRYLAEFIVNVCNYSALIGTRDDRCLIKGELAKLSSLVGKYAFHELLVEEKAGTRYVHLVYLVGYDRQPLRFELRLYRPSSEWRFQGVSFDAKLVEDVEKAANQRVSR